MKPLTGLTVIDFSKVLAGPLCAELGYADDAIARLRADNAVFAA